MTKDNNWEERLEDLKCINGAMYFGSVEDDSCNCKTRCQNEQTYDNALSEIKHFISTLLQEQKEETVRQIEETRGKYWESFEDTRVEMVLEEVINKI